jgi:hypothetical protein
MGTKKVGALSSRHERAIYILAQRIDLCLDIFYSARILISNHTFSQRNEIFGDAVIVHSHPLALKRKTSLASQRGEGEKELGGRAVPGADNRSIFYYTRFSRGKMSIVFIGISRRPEPSARPDKFLFVRFRVIDIDPRSRVSFFRDGRFRFRAF